MLAQIANLTHFQRLYLPEYSKCVGMQTQIVSKQVDLRRGCEGTYKNFISNRSLSRIRTEYPEGVSTNQNASFHE